MEGERRWRRREGVGGVRGREEGKRGWRRREDVVCKVEKGGRWERWCWRVMYLDRSVRVWRGGWERWEEVGIGGWERWVGREGYLDKIVHGRSQSRKILPLKTPPYSRQDSRL